MGYYIPSCTKMRYKSAFRPQYVLDPITYTWDAFDDTTVDDAVDADGNKRTTVQEGVGKKQRQSPAAAPRPQPRSQTRA